ncbi:MAG: hypothetical protein OXM02_02805 [Bacteroidota bacterium]|nr:hypothetical protein [Bacteroidota bacterium]MDE2833431.1 hypothetical protein [Bacteroidota bacterium]
MASTPGGYCLRTNMLDMEAEALWRTYVMLTDLEAIFRSLKNELGSERSITGPAAEGRLFLTVLANQVVRLRLRQKGLALNWSRLRGKLSSQIRASSAKSSRTVQMCVTSEPDICQRELHLASGLNPAPSTPIFSPSDPDSGQKYCCDQVGPYRPV